MIEDINTTSVHIKDVTAPYQVKHSTKHTILYRETHDTEEVHSYRITGANVLYNYNKKLLVKVHGKTIHAGLKGGNHTSIKYNPNPTKPVQSGPVSRQPLDTL